MNGTDQEDYSGDVMRDAGAGESKNVFTQIGTGEIGGKAQGLVRLEGILRNQLNRDKLRGIEVDIPWFRVIGTDWFDAFMEQNRLYNIALSDTRDRHMVNAFQKGVLPAELMDDLKKLISEVHVPLAVRSSSRLEDALDEPFAGVYGTKMVPNNQFSPETRLRALAEAVKFVYASTFTQNAKSYRRALGRSDKEEKMAVMIQEVVGMRHGDRFYPNISGVARSYNFYALGHATPQDGLVCLALGLGKTIVDGGRSWHYCPVCPKAKPPFGSIKEMLNETQTEYWCVNMGKPPLSDPTQETEYLFEGNLGHAEEDGVLHELASTCDPQSERLTMGIGRRGPRVLDFAPLLELGDIPFNEVVREVMTVCEDEYHGPVEIEFAANFGRAGTERAKFGFLQVRPMFVSEDHVDVAEHELNGSNVFVASRNVLGNGQSDVIKDVVYVRRDRFDAKDSWLVAGELDAMNRILLEAERPYLLVVLGRLGSSDPWLGVPVKWGQVSGARVVVEAFSDEMNVDMSQGSHFFHNVTCLKIFYFSTDKTGEFPVNWQWLEGHEGVHESKYVRHVELGKPLHVKVDGKSGRGVIRFEGPDSVGN